MQIESGFPGTPAGVEAGHFHRLFQEIHRRAYQRFLDRQRRALPGTEAEDWRMAEREVLEEAGMIEPGAPPPVSEVLPEPPTFAPWMSGEPPVGSSLSSAELLDRMAHGAIPHETGGRVSPDLAELEVRHAMTRELIAVGPECTVRQLVTVLDQNHASALPVVDGQRKLLGVVSASDLIHLHARAASMAAEYVRSGQVPVNGTDPELVMGMVTGELLATMRADQALGSQVPTTTPGAKLLDVVAMMASRRLDRVLVVEGGFLVGMLAAPDLLRLLLSDIGHAPP